MVLRRLAAVGGVFVLCMGTAHAQEKSATVSGSEPPLPKAATITGSEPPLPKPAAPAAAPKPAGKAAQKLSLAAIDAKIVKVQGDMEDIKRKAGIGNEALQKWAGTAEQFRAFAASAREIEANCELQKSRLHQDEQRNANAVVLNAAREGVKECVEDTNRLQQTVNVYDSIVTGMQEEVNRVSEDVDRLGNMSEDKRKKLVSLELEKALGQKVDDSQDKLQKFQAQH